MDKFSNIFISPLAMLIFSKNHNLKYKIENFSIRFRKHQHNLQEQLFLSKNSQSQPLEKGCRQELAVFPYLF